MICICISTMRALSLLIYSGGVGLPEKYPNRLYGRYSIWITISLANHIFYHLVVPGVYPPHGRYRNRIYNYSSGSGGRNRQWLNERKTGRGGASRSATEGGSILLVLGQPIGSPRRKERAGDGNGGNLIKLNIALFISNYKLYILGKCPCITPRKNNATITLV